MNENPFGRPQQLHESNLFQRLFHRQPKENALVELQNLLASHPLAQIQVQDVGAIESRYGFRLKETFPDEMRGFYAVYLRSCLTPPEFALDASAQQELAHLAALLDISDEERERARAELAMPLYSTAIEAAISDERLSEEDMAMLQRARENLGLSQAEAAQAYVKRAQQMVGERLFELVSDERLSPEDEEELRTLSDRLGIELRLTDEVGRRLDRYRRYWEIESGTLPVVEPDIFLQKNETCHFMVSVEWFELRTVTRRVRYAGPTARIRLAKGLYFRAGDVGVQRVTEDVMTQMDTGRVYITNKRILFNGHRKNSTIRLNRIIEFIPYRNGVQIEKDAGKSPFFAFDEDVDLFALTLDRVLRDARDG